MARDFVITYLVLTTSFYVLLYFLYALLDFSFNDCNYMAVKLSSYIQSLKMIIICLLSKQYESRSILTILKSSSMLLTGKHYRERDHNILYIVIHQRAANWKLLKLEVQKYYNSKCILQQQLVLHLGNPWMMRSSSKLDAIQFCSSLR